MKEQEDGEVSFHMTLTQLHTVTIHTCTAQHIAMVTMFSTDWTCSPTQTHPECEIETEQE